MNKTITKFHKQLRTVSKGITLVILATLAFASQSKAQYPGVSHTTNPCVDATISTVIIEDADGNVMFSKSDLCSGSAATNYLTVFGSPTAPIVTLSAGSEYTIRMNCTSTGGDDGTANGGIWIDYDADENFNGSGEWLTTSSWQNFIPNGTNGNTPTATVSTTFTVPCNISNSTSRIRLRSADFGAAPNANTYTGALIDGESEDFVIQLALPSGLSSDFFAPTTAFTGTPVTFTNSNQAGYISQVWDVDGTTYNSINATHVFAAAGTYTVKLKSENCLGVDSTTKMVTIVDPSAPPVANFVSNKNVVEIFETFTLIDLSSNGATYWNWMIANATDTINVFDQAVLAGNYANGSNTPVVQTGSYPGAVGVGLWDVYLSSSNIIGASAPYSKVGYITVQQTSFNMGPATSLPANIITASSGELFDKGGPTANYTTPESNLEALIAPCGATSVSLDFSVFALNANANLKIYDGVNALGTPLHPGNGFSSADNPASIGTLTASSGTMYLLWNSTAGATDEGFAATWSSVAGTGATPVASFTLPGSVLYNSVYVDFINTSLNAEGNTSFQWTVTGPGGTVTSSSRDLLQEIFTTNGTYTITLLVTTCDGQTNSVTQTFDVITPTTPTELDFVADNRRPSVGDDVVLTATSDKANRWEWAIFPQTGHTSTVNDNINNRTFTFTAPGSYTVQCVGFNTKDTLASLATVVKTAYIIVVQPCTPTISVTASTDVAISYVSLEDVSSGDKFENPSSTGVEYTDFSSLGTIELNYGGTYNFEVRRATNINPMSRKIWVDWNVDGDFDDADEEIDVDPTGTSLSWTGSFVVPASAFEANTILRIGTSYDTDPNDPCGASINTAANRVGEFEDYSIRVVNDGDIPVITLVGLDTVYVEQNDVPPYMTDGATAFDASQGDITTDLVMTSDLDQSLPGIYYEEWNVSDASGNPADPITRVIYVTADRTPPVITINGSADTTIEVGTPWVDLGATAIDNKEGDITNAIIITDNVDANLLGNYTVLYEIQDNQGNAASATRIVRVVDTEVPVIVNDNADKSGACWVVEVQLQNIFADVTSATDNYNSIGNGLTFKADPAAAQGGAAVDTRFQGTTTVTYTATDESNNVTTQCVDYVVKDYIPPVIDLRTLDVVTHSVGSIYTPVAPIATDNLYGPSEISLVLTSSNVNGFVLGTYQDVYTATDAAGNISTKTRTVHVIDDVNPVISGKNGGVLRVGVGSSVDAINHILFSDNYDSPTDLKANHTLIYNNINLQESGIYTAVFRTVDNSGNPSNDFTLYVDCDYNYEIIQAGLEDIALEDLLSIYPNPTKGNLVINVNLPENEEINIALYNTMGQQVALVQNGKVNNGKFTLDIADQTNGIYYVKMNLKGNIITKKVVLNK